MSLNIQNLDRLISHLEGLPKEKFDMRAFYCRDGEIEFPYLIRGSVAHTCGTAACIAGWIFEIDENCPLGSIGAGSWLDLNEKQSYELFAPAGYQSALSYPLYRAIRTLKHMRSEYLRTGEVVVDWDAPEPVTKPEWTAPRAVEQAKPTLPAEVVRFLRPADHEVSA